MAITLNDNGYAVQLAVPPNAFVLGSSVNSSIVTRVVNVGAGQTAIASSILGAPATGIFVWDFDLPAMPIQIGNTPNNVSRGFQLTDVTLRYAFPNLSSNNASAGASTMTFNAFTTKFVDQTIIVNPGTSQSSGSSGTPYGGTFTFSGGIGGSSTAMAVAPSSTVQVVVCTPQTSLAPFINTDNTRLVFEWAFNSGTATSFNLNIFGATIHGTWLFGG